MSDRLLGITSPDDQRVPGSAGSQDFSHEEENASRFPYADGPRFEPAMPPVPREGGAQESPGHGPLSPTAAPAEAELAVELPRSKQPSDFAFVAPVVPQLTPPTTERPASLGRASPQPRLPTAGRSSASVPSAAGCAAPSLSARPPYLAAGVLPFCVLGGDLLFLLGQQLRFRSLVKSSSSVKSGVSTPPMEGMDCGASSALAKDPSSGAMPQIRGARRGPRPKISLSGPSLAGPLHADASPSPGVVAVDGSHGQEAKVEEAASQRVSDARSGTEHGTRTSACTVRPQAEKGTMVPPVGDDIGVVGKHSATTDMAQGRCSEVAKDPPSVVNNPAVSPGTGRTGTKSGDIIPQDGVSKTAMLPEETYSAAAVTNGETSPWREQPAAAPRQGTVPAGLLWSDFGGTKEDGDADAEETASREFAEESFGIFNGVRLESDSVARSQATMSTALRDPFLRGKRVFECRNGGYVMFIAEVNFVPDLMMNLARNEIVGDVSDSGAGVEGNSGGNGQGRASSPGFSEKTDFAWVPGSVLLQTMRESRNRSTRKVVVKLGGCRYLRLFHKFVISLWGLDLAAVIQAASTPLRVRRSLPPPRVLLLTSSTVALSRWERNEKEASGESGDKTTAGGRVAAIRGIDCVRPSFLSGRKRTSLGIINVRRDCRWDSGGGSRAGCEYGEAGHTAGASERNAGGDGSGGGGSSPGEGLQRSRSRKSGAACRKRRRKCKQARRFKAAAKLEAAVVAAAGVPSTAVLPVVALGGDLVQTGMQQPGHGRL